MYIYFHTLNCKCTTSLTEYIFHQTNFTIWCINLKYVNISAETKDSIRSQYANLSIALSNATDTAPNSFSKVQSVSSNEHRFVALLNTPEEFQFLRIERASESAITICEVKLIEPGLFFCIAFFAY